jgi:hypothetical protein
MGQGSVDAGEVDRARCFVEFVEANAKLAASWGTATVGEGHQVPVALVLQHHRLDVEMVSTIDDVNRLKPNLPRVGVAPRESARTVATRRAGALRSLQVWRRMEALLNAG